MRTRLIAGGTILAAVVLSLGIAKASLARSGRDDRIDVSGATFGQITKSDVASQPDFIEVAWPGPEGEMLYVSFKDIESGKVNEAAVPVIDRDGFVVGEMVPGHGLVIDGKPVFETPPVSTSYVTVP